MVADRVVAEHFFDSVRLDAQRSESCTSGRSNVVHSHELDLVSSDRRSRQTLREESQCLPNYEWNGNEHASRTEMLADHPQHVLVAVNMRTAQFVDCFRLRGVERAHNRIPNIFHASRLQRCPAAPEQGKDWGFAQQFDQWNQKRIVRS